MIFRVYYNNIYTKNRKEKGYITIIKLSLPRKITEIQKNKIIKNTGLKCLFQYLKRQEYSLQALHVIPHRLELHGDTHLVHLV